MKRFRYKEGISYLLLFILTAVFCWLYVGRLGIFGAKVDWISQHSVLPDYFRKQFYETGELFPEFALNIGGGQNIYHFAYYGLYSPLVLLSYLLPFVKMQDYMMAVQFLCLAGSVMLMYRWLRGGRPKARGQGEEGEMRRDFGKPGFPVRIAFGMSVIFLLSGPMIFHSYNQVMFVNYMPFLCMGLLGVDRYFDRGRWGLLTAGVFLMVMTSFYFSIGGMLALVLYGIFRYFGLCGEKGFKISVGGFLSAGLKFLLPFIAGVLLSGILLVPTAMALTGREGSAAQAGLSELLLPRMPVDRFLYTPYGIGLTSLSITALLSMLFFRKLHERVLAWSCLAVLAVPVFSWLLNGGLYLRDKVMIPFLPLLCFVMAYYLWAVETGERRLASYLPYAASLLVIGADIGKGDVGKYWKLLAADAVVMLLCFFAADLFGRFRGKRRHALFLLLPSIAFLILFGGILHAQADRAVEKGFHEKVTDGRAGSIIRETLDQEEGLYRTEQSGDDEENAANLNRIHDMSQLVSSIYSSSYHKDYQRFREETFEAEEPFRNFLMQPALSNPVYQDFMGVKYVLRRTEAGDFQMSVNENALPVAFATDRAMPEEEYRKLAFPYNQLALLEYAAVEKGGRLGESGEAEQAGSKQAMQIMQETYRIKEVDAGLPGRISTKSRETAAIRLPEHAQGEQVLFLQFHVKNLRPSKDVAVWVEGVRNKLTSRNHFYYNDNTTFSYGIPLKKGQKQAEVTFGEGMYDISEVNCYLGVLPEERAGLCQSEFLPDKKKTKGSVIAGEIHAGRDGYFVTTIPYEDGFQVSVDGRETEKEKVNTAFLGFRLKEGEHRIEIRYHAPGVLAGKIMSLLGVLAAFFNEYSRKVTKI